MASHSILWDAITYPCLRYLLLAPKLTLTNDHTCPSIFQVLMYQDATTTFDMSQTSTYCGLATPNYVMALCHQISFSIVYKIEIRVSSLELNYCPKRQNRETTIFVFGALNLKKRFGCSWYLWSEQSRHWIETKNVNSFLQRWYSNLLTIISDAADAQITYTQCNQYVITFSATIIVFLT